MCCVSVYKRKTIVKINKRISRYNEQYFSKMKKFMKNSKATCTTPRFGKIKRYDYDFCSPTSLFKFSQKDKYDQFVCGLNKRSKRVQGVKPLVQKRRCKSLEIMFGPELVGYKEESKGMICTDIDEDVFGKSTGILQNANNECYIEKVPDEIIMLIFQKLTIADLGRCVKVSKQFRRVVWTKHFFKYNLIFDEASLDVDLAIKEILKHFVCKHYNPWQKVTKICVKDGAKVSNRTLQVLAGKCPELKTLIIRDCQTISNQGLFQIIAGSQNLVHLDVSGCKLITAACDNYMINNHQLKLLDLTDCTDLEDSGVKCISTRFQNLARLSLRGCNKITDASVSYIAEYCQKLQQLSLADCVKITDYATWSLYWLRKTLVYLSIENLTQITDEGIRCIGDNLTLQHLNMSGCTGVSDYGVICLGNSCITLKTLNLSNTNVCDPSLCIIGDNLVALRCLSLQNCNKITEKGVNYLVYHRRGLLKLCIKDCKLPSSCFKYIKKCCKYCCVEHNNIKFDIITKLIGVY